MKRRAILVEEGDTLRPRRPIIMSCDPGKSGGICWNDRYGNLHACAMPETVSMLANVIREARPDFFLLEKVRSSPQMGVVSAFTFGQGLGNIVGIITALKIFWKEVSPQTWIKNSDLGKVKDHDTSRLWKKHLLRHAKKLSPSLFRGLNMTESLKISDAVLLWHFAVLLYVEYEF